DRSRLVAPAIKYLRLQPEIEPEPETERRERRAAQIRVARKMIDPDLRPQRAVLIVNPVSHAEPATITGRCGGSNRARLAEQPNADVRERSIGPARREGVLIAGGRDQEAQSGSRFVDPQQS